jgi:hypothetical protein
VLTASRCQFAPIHRHLASPHAASRTLVALLPLRPSTTLPCPTTPTVATVPPIVTWYTSSCSGMG